MKKVYRIALLTAIIWTAGTSVLQAQEVDYKYHAVFMYNFTRYVKWPEASIGKEFVIGVYGKSGVTEHLEKMAQTKTVNGTPIVIKIYQEPSEVDNCHMLFLPENYSSKLSEIRQLSGGKPMLVISEKPGMARKGSDINFILNNGRWNFELNQASTDQNNLKVSSELSKFAHKIYTEI